MFPVTQSIRSVGRGVRPARQVWALALGAWWISHAGLAAAAVRDLGPAILDSTKVVLVTNGAARAYQPLTVAEVGQSVGRSLPPDTILTLPSGKKARLRDALAQVNQLEQQLNRQGYSLRDANRHFRVKRLKHDYTKLALDTQAITSAHKSFDATTMTPRIATDMLLTTDPVIVKGLTSSLSPTATIGYVAQTYSYEKSWSKETGDRDLIAAGFGADLDLSGDKDDLHIDAGAKGYGYLLGKEVDVLKVTGSLDSRDSGNQSLDLSVYLAGYQLLDYDSDQDKFDKSQSWTESVQAKTTVYFPLILGLQVKVETGVNGTAKAGYQVQIEPMEAAAKVTSDLDVDVYAEAAISGGIPDVAEVEAGVRGTLTLIDDNLELVGTGTLDLNGSTSFKDWTFELQYYAYNELNMLSGNIYVFAGLDFCWPFNKYDCEEDFELFSYSGISSSGYLFNEKKSIPVYKKST
jgi:hypothetical protein